MTELQEKILQLVQEIDHICRENKIEYFIEGGSALGAIRHGGFLPWDDDADLAMTRENWDKFAHVMATDPPPGRVLESAEWNIEYPTIAMRYVDTTSTRLWKSWMCDKCANGIAIDIMVLEDAPDDEDLLRRMEDDLIDYNEFIYRHYRQSRLGDWKRYRHLRKLSQLIGRKKVADQMNKKLLKYYGTGSSRYLMRWGLRFQVYDKKIFGSPQYVPFEDTMLPVPERTVEYLSYQFGIDWYTMPEGDDAVVHDPVILDMDVGYGTYMDTYMPQVNKKNFLKTIMRVKDLQMKVMDPNRAYHRGIYGAAARGEALDLRAKTERLERELGQDLETIFGQVTDQSRAQFKQLFGGYMTKQFNQWYLYYRVLVPADDRVLGCILSFLIRLGELARVEKVLALCREKEMQMGPGMSRAARAWELAKQTLDLFWAGDLDGAADLTENAPEDLARSPIQLAIVCLRQVRDAGAEELPALRERIGESLARFPEEDVFRLAYAWALERQGYAVSAARVLERLADTSRNGMVVRMIRTGGTCFPLRRDMSEEVTRQ